MDSPGDRRLNAESTLPLDDSRRLLGGNLFFAGTGVVLETIGIRIDDALLSGWRSRVERARRHLGWDAGPTGAAAGPVVVTRRHAQGASLALQAPVDQLFTATELNEWAWCATLHERDPARWANVMDALLEDYLADATDPAQVIPPVLDETRALARLSVRAASERRPDIVALDRGGQRARRVSPARRERVDARGRHRRPDVAARRPAATRTPCPGPRCARFQRPP